jgi:hypothetical protein
VARACLHELDLIVHDEKKGGSQASAVDDGVFAMMLTNASTLASMQSSEDSPRSEKVLSTSELLICIRHYFDLIAAIDPASAPNSSFNLCFPSNASWMDFQAAYIWHRSWDKHPQRKNRVLKLLPHIVSVMLTTVGSVNDRSIATMNWGLLITSWCIEDEPNINGFKKFVDILP